MCGPKLRGTVLAAFAKGAPGKAMPSRRFGVSGTGKALDVKKAVFALATAATLGVTALVTPSPAQAWRGGWGPGLAGGLIAGAVINGIASSAYTYGPGYGYYGGPGYGYYGGGYYGGPRYGYYRGYAPVYGGYAPGPTVLSGLVIAQARLLSPHNERSQRCLRPFCARRNASNDIRCGGRRVLRIGRFEPEHERYERPDFT
jgi:hypothetical protein